MSKRAPLEGDVTEEGKSSDALDNKEEEDSPDCNAPDAVFAPCCVVDACDCASSSRRLELLFAAAMMI